jgi:hypothetical protein
MRRPDGLPSLLTGAGVIRGYSSYCSYREDQEASASEEHGGSPLAGIQLEFPVESCFSKDL